MGMFLRAKSNFTERFGTKFAKDEKTGASKVYKLGKAKKIGSGHIFWHPDTDRANALIAMGEGKGGVAIVEAVTSMQILKYIKDALTGARDPKTKEIIREPIPLAALEPEVQKFWKDQASKMDKATPDTAVKEEPEPGSPAPDAGEVDEDPDKDPDEKPKAKGGRKGRK